MGVQLVQQVDQIADLVLILRHVHLHRLGQDSANSLSDLIGKTATLGGR